MATMDQLTKNLATNYRLEEAKANSTLRSEQKLNTDNQLNPIVAEVQVEEEPTLFDILKEEARDIDDDDPAEEE